MAGLNPEIVRYLQRCQERLELQPQEMRVLDYGCGAGQSVLTLRSMGYQAFGVDVDKNAILAGQKLLDEHEFEGKSILLSFDANGPLPFRGKCFHFVMSQEVIEHVNNISIMARELRRISAPRSMSFHVFRPQYNVLEPHFHMPFVHWLPKNRLRKYAITLSAYLGIGLHPREIASAGPSERADFLYRYSVGRTFYRPYQMIGKAFRECGFGICFPAANHRRIRESGFLSWIFRMPPADRLLSWFLMTFRTAYLLTQTPDENEMIDKQIQMGSWTFAFTTS